MFAFLNVGCGGSEAIEALYSKPDDQGRSYITWVDFAPTYTVMLQALMYDINSFGEDLHFNWIELLAYVACKNGNRFKDQKSEEMDKLVKKLKEGATMEELTANMKYYKYYLEAYTAVLKEYVGIFEVETEKNGVKTKEIRYGLKVYSPIARGYAYSHCDDFGNDRSYGFRRKHLGHDIMGRIGTPIVAVEGGTITALGWNRYGGWRIGIRSDDGLRYYYYAHLRKNNPYAPGLKEGDRVEAGQVIGYLGMTGYSIKENVNNIRVPHLHFGIQLIFDKSQESGAKEIWIDCYHIVRLLSKNRSVVIG